MVLTNDETTLIVSTCRDISLMGLGIDEDTCLDIVNNILSARIEEKYFVPVTRKVVKRIMSENRYLLTLIKGNSIDPKRVSQADEDVMHALFVKFDNYIKILHSENKVEWKDASTIPPDCISNMDEIATNAHNHRKKLIADKLHYGRLFQEVNAGDNKIPFHISMCITSKPKGKLLLSISDCLYTNLSLLHIIV